MIKKGLDVKILTGKDKNKTGEVIEVDRNNDRIKIKGTNMIKTHVKTKKDKIVTNFQFTFFQRRNNNWTANKKGTPAW